jgi:hypothetical protein
LNWWYVDNSSANVAVWIADRYLGDIIDYVQHGNNKHPSSCSKQATSCYEEMGPVEYQWRDEILQEAGVMATQAKTY